MPGRTQLASQPTARTHTDSRPPRGAQLLVTAMNSTEAYPVDDHVARSHAENPYGNRSFDETLSNKDTFDAKFHGSFVVKPNSRSSLKGAGAVIACFLGGQIALGAPAAKTRSNGEVLFCENLAMADAARAGAHGGGVARLAQQVRRRVDEWRAGGWMNGAPLRAIVVATATLMLDRAAAAPTFAGVSEAARVAMAAKLLARREELAEARRWRMLHVSVGGKQQLSTVVWEAMCGGE